MLSVCNYCDGRGSFETECYEGEMSCDLCSGTGRIEVPIKVTALSEIVSEPQPIETAPRDGTIILTDAGVCQSSRNGWIACTVDGWDLCNSSEQSASKQSPTLWTPLPDWMKK